MRYINNTKDSKGDTLFIVIYTYVRGGVCRGLRVNGNSDHCPLLLVDCPVLITLDHTSEFELAGIRAPTRNIYQHGLLFSSQYL